MTQEIYDKEYYLRHLSYNGTPVERELNGWRTSFMKKAFAHLKHSDIWFLDYGCSHGAFIDVATTELGIKGLGVEVNPYCIAHCTTLGQKVFTSEMFDYFYGEKKIVPIITFWDVFEHLRNPKDLLDRHKPEAICLSLPCLDGYYEAYGREADIQLWKHWRPLEHLWSFTVDSCASYLRGCGYRVVEQSFDESRIRRDGKLGLKNIMSFVAIREDRNPHV